MILLYGPVCIIRLSVYYSAGVYTQYDIRNISVLYTRRTLALGKPLFLFYHYFLYIYDNDDDRFNAVCKSLRIERRGCSSRARVYDCVYAHITL